MRWSVRREGPALRCGAGGCDVRRSPNRGQVNTVRLHYRVRTKHSLTHLRADGSVTMVDVGAKAQTQRTAVARAIVRLGREAFAALKSGTLKKGDALAAAQIAGILAAKRTAELIPLCHPLPLTHVDVRCRLQSGSVIVTATASCLGPTGVEMEALTAASVAALAIYDMCKALNRGITIEQVALLEKTGGKSGAYRR